MRNEAETRDRNEGWLARESSAYRRATTHDEAGDEMTDDLEARDAMADAHPSTAAIAGHPIHPMLVPIPIGTLAAAAVSDLFWSQTKDPFWARAGSWLLGGSLISAAAAGPFGLVDFLTIPAARRRPEAWLHAIGNVGVASMAAASLVLRRRNRDRVDPAPMALSLGAASLLVVTGWLGGELSYRHRIGVTQSSSMSGDDATKSASAAKPRARRASAATDAGTGTTKSRGRGARSGNAGTSGSGSRGDGAGGSDATTSVGVGVMDEAATSGAKAQPRPAAR